MKKILIVAILLTTVMFAQIKKKMEVPYVAFPIKMGQGFDAIQANCLMCHSFGYIINQGRQSRKFWLGKVTKMITHFKAPITPEAVKETTDYLFKHYGNGKKE